MPSTTHNACEQDHEVHVTLA